MARWKSTLTLASLISLLSFLSAAEATAKPSGKHKRCTGDGCVFGAYPQDSSWRKALGGDCPLNDLTLPKLLSDRKQWRELTDRYTWLPDDDREPDGCQERLFTAAARFGQMAVMVVSGWRSPGGQPSSVGGKPLTASGMIGIELEKLRQADATVGDLAENGRLTWKTSDGKRQGAFLSADIVNLDGNTVAVGLYGEWEARTARKGEKRLMQVWRQLLAANEKNRAK